MALNLKDIFLLPRANVYTNPKNTGDKLPLPYGDLTDGTDGIWELPCIDTVNHVYAYAGFDVLSIGEGNSVTTCVDGVQTASTFNNSNDYESQGLIATCTFAASQGNKKVTARGKGRDSSGTLIENVIDQVVDFIDNVCSEDSSTELDATTKALAKSIFTTQGYKAAGVITDDISYWSLFQRMLSSFYGRVYEKADNTLAFIIDDGTIYQYAQVDRLEKGAIYAIQVERDTDDIINRCPIRYAYNYVAKKYRKEVLATTYENTASQTTYGVQTPKKGFYELAWCRDQTTAQAIQELYIDDYAQPKWKFNLTDHTYRLIQGDMHDILCLSIPWLYGDDGQPYINQFFKILRNTISFNKNQITFRCKDTKKYLTKAYLADSTYKADGSVKAGGERDTQNYLS
jgi:hypothetical protein